MKHGLSKNCRRRLGISSIEFLVSFSVLVSTMTFITTMAVQVNRIWKEIELDRLAINELANHLDVLTQLRGQNLVTELEQRSPSQFCQNGLPDPKLLTTLTPVPIGHRIDLELKWKHNPEPRSVRLSGWVIDPKTNPFKQALEETEKDTEENQLSRPTQPVPPEGQP